MSKTDDVLSEQALQRQIQARLVEVRGASCQFVAAPTLKPMAIEKGST